MKKKNILTQLILLFGLHQVQGATFTIQNFSGRDVFVKPFWKSSTPITYTKLPAGQKLSFNSGLHGIEKIEWITDKFNDMSWVGYVVDSNEGKILDAIKTMKEFRIYADGKYENNFNSSSSIMQAAQLPTQNFLLYVGNTQVFLSGNKNPYVVVENATNGVVLVNPIEVGQRGFVSGEYDCIEPKGSKYYSVGAFAGHTTGFSSSIERQRNLICIKQDNGQWYVLRYKLSSLIPAAQGKYALPGKIQIFPGQDTIRYKLSYNGQVLEIDPEYKSAVATPASCQLSK